MPTQEKQSTDRRKVAGLFVQYTTLVEDARGDLQPILRSADRGEYIDITEAEQSRLDALGMLEQPGVDGEKVRQDLQERYRAARGDQEAAELVMARALNPLDNVDPNLEREEQPSAAPTGGGVAPRGDLVTGDTGGPDTPAPGVDESSGIVRLDAPDPREATVGDLAAWISEEKANVTDTVNLAEGEPGLAAKLLEAESVATEGAPRATVEKALQKIIDAGK